MAGHLPNADEIALGNGRFHGAGQDFLRPAQDGLFKSWSLYISKLLPLELRLPGPDAPRGFLRISCSKASSMLASGDDDTAPNRVLAPVAMGRELRWHACS
jgi:hypothetical protein